MFEKMFSIKQWNNKTMKQWNRGFTLTELLVVIAIIGILASVVTISTGSARQKSRDAKRKADLETIAGALEIYYAEEKSYPKGEHSSRSDVTWKTLAKDLVPDYISELPIAPKNGGQDGVMKCTNCDHYHYQGYVGEKYILCAYLARDTEDKTGKNEYGPYYCVTSLGCEPASFYNCKSVK